MLADAVVLPHCPGLLLPHPSWMPRWRPNFFFAAALQWGYEYYLTEDASTALYVLGPGEMAWTDARAYCQ